MFKTLFLLNLASLALLVVGLIGYALALHLLERRVSRYVAHRLGWRAVLVTGWIGVPLHELSHLAMAKLFGHRIIGYKLFDPDPVSGTLGYVRHGYRHPTLWQRSGYFFIGIAPLIAGSIALVALLVWMAGGATPLLEVVRRWPAAGSAEALLQQLPFLGRAASQLFDTLWTRREPYLAAQLYLGVCVAAHMAPSRADLGSALSSLLSLVGMMLVAASAGAAMGVGFGAAVQLIALLPLLFALVLIWQLALVGTIALFERLRKDRRRAMSRS